MMRVPTYMNYMNMLNGTLANKAAFNLYNFQSINGLKAPTYAGFGRQAYNVVSLEASLNLTSNYIDNNTATQIETKAMNTAIQSIYKATTEFKSMLSNFQSSLNNITPDYTGGKISFTDDNAAYLGETITINGVQYTFENDAAGNNVDISGLTQGSATYAEDVMAALKAKIDAVNPNPDIVVNGGDMTFPMYMVDGESSVLNASGIETGEAHTMTQDQYLALQQLQAQAFATMMIVADTLNVNANGKYFFGGGVANGSPINFPFTNLDDFQAYYDGLNITYPTNTSSNLSNRSVTASETGDITLQLTNGNNGTISAANAGGFLTEAIVANTSTTGDLTFDAAKNTVRATEYGAFNTLKTGDTLVLGGAGIDPANAKAYTIKEISSDGKTITFEDSTPVVASETVTPNNDVTFSTSFPVGSVITMDGFGQNIAKEVQVTGVSDDGSTLYIKADPSRFPTTPQTITTANWSMSCSSYYQGGDLISEKRVAENQSLTFDIKASDPAFEKLLRALGEIAQGNLVDTRNPADPITGLIDSSATSERVNDALTLISEALFNPNEHSTNTRNYDLYTVSAKVASNAIVLENVMTNQTLVKNNLENGITNIKTVDKDEAGTKALVAYNNLSASYSVLNTAMNISLLDYL